RVVARGHPGAVFPEAGEVAAVRRTDGVSGLLRADDHGAAETSRAAVRKTMRRSLHVSANARATVVRRSGESQSRERLAVKSPVPREEVRARCYGMGPDHEVWEDAVAAAALPAVSLERLPRQVDGLARVRD